VSSCSKLVEQVKPVGPWVLIRLDRRPGTKGSIILPDNTGVDNVQERSGRIVAMGEGISDRDIMGNEKLHKTFPFGLKDGKKVVPAGIEVGARVVYRGFLGQVHQGNFFDIADDAGNEFTFLHMGSLDLVISDDTPIGEWDVTATE
jgi:co-chaperonin GroES (HSP10)